MAMFANELVRGNFRVQIEEKKFKPGNVMTQDRYSMGKSLGKHLVILHTEFDEVTRFSIVDERTGDAIIVQVSDVEAEAKELWDSMAPDQQSAAAEALRNFKKIEAMRIIRLNTGAELKPAKNCIDSAYVLDIAHKK